MRSGVLSNLFPTIILASRHKELLCKFLLNELGWKSREGTTEELRRIQSPGRGLALGGRGATCMFLCEQRQGGKFG